MLNPLACSLSRLRPAFLVGAGFLTGLVQAQVFLGSDNFNDNTLTVQGASNQTAGLWRFSTPNSAGTGGAWTETNQRMEYTTTATTGVNRGLLGWVSPSYSTSNSALPSPNLNIGGNGLSSGAPYTSNWSAKVSVTNTLSSIGSGYTYTGLEFYTLNDADGFASTTISPSNNAYYGLYLSTNATSGSRIIFEWGKWNSGISDFDRVSTYSTATSTSGVVLRMDFDGTSKVMTGYFSFDSGASFTSAGTFNLASTQAGIAAVADNGMGLELLGLASSIGVAITSGQIFFDNLSVTAIPEPATYTAIIGAGVLGFALRRRRRAQE